MAAKERKVIRGIVLRSVDTREADKILTVLTGESGKLAVVAKGARSRRSRVTAATQFLAYSELTVSESHGWQMLAEASTIELFSGIRQDIALLSLASYFAELTDAVTYEGLPAEETLALLLNALYALGTLNYPQTVVKTGFELKLMALSGFEPLVDRCAVCGAAEMTEPMLDVVRGTLHCARCPQKGGLSMPLGAAGLAAMRHILYGNPKRLYAFRLPEDQLRWLNHAAEAYVAAQLERGFRTLEFYKQLATD